MTGTFRVPVRWRTNEQRNGVRHFQRCKHEFDIADDKLLYRGLEVSVIDKYSARRRYHYGDSYVKTSKAEPTLWDSGISMDTTRRKQRPNQSVKQCYCYGNIYVKTSAPTLWDNGFVIGAGRHSHIQIIKKVIITFKQHKPQWCSCRYECIIGKHFNVMYSLSFGSFITRSCIY